MGDNAPTDFPAGIPVVAQAMFTRLYSLADDAPRSLVDTTARCTAEHLLRQKYATPTSRDVEFVAMHCSLYGFDDRSPTIHQAFHKVIDDTKQAFEDRAVEISQADRLAQLTASNMEREKKYAAIPLLRKFDQRKQMFENHLGTITPAIAAEKIMERIKNKSLTPLACLLYSYAIQGTEAARDFMLANLAMYGDDDQRLIEHHNCFITSLFRDPEVFFEMFPNAVLDSPTPLLPPGEEFYTYNSNMAREFEKHIAESATSGSGPQQLSEDQRKKRAIKSFRPSLCRETVESNLVIGGDPWLQGYMDDNQMVHVDAADIAQVTANLFDRISALETAVRESEKNVQTNTMNEQKPLTVEDW